MIRLFSLLPFLLLLTFNIQAQEDSIPAMRFGSFSLERELVLPGPPEKVYDMITGDVSPWWQQRFTRQPYRLVIEPNPGGGFWEIFDASGDGVRHATVIYAQRGKLLRLDGPIGLSGRAVQYVTSFYLSSVDANKTMLRLSVYIAGAYEPAVPEMVNQMWDKLLFQQLLPYAEQQLGGK